MKRRNLKHQGKKTALGAILVTAVSVSNINMYTEQDLKTINLEESYLVDGLPVALTKNLGEVGHGQFSWEGDFFSVTPGGNGLITIDLVPKSSVYWTASVNGIEVLKP